MYSLVQGYSVDRSVVVMRTPALCFSAYFRSNSRTLFSVSSSRFDTGSSATIREVVDEVLKGFPEPYSRIVDVAISVASYVVKRFSRPRVAVLMDDVFQAIGLDKAEIYVKALLNLIEYPPREYERIVVIVASSEDVTWEGIGRNRWTDILVMWNISRNGFEELYRLLPDRKPPLEEVW